MNRDDGRPGRSPGADENPFRPPVTDAPAGHVVMDGPRGRMPGTVIAVVALVGVAMLLMLLSALRSPGSSVAQLAIATLILIGLIRGHALSWQWGIIMPILMVGLMSLSLIPMIAMGGAGIFELLIIMVMMVPNIAIPILLHQRSSRIFFRLRCPSCGGVRVKAGNFMFTRRVCRNCKTAWVVQ